MQVLYKKIILATDFSDTSKEADYYALKLAQSNKVRLLKALHVFDTNAWNTSPSYYMYMKPTKLKLDRVIEDYEKIPQREKNALTALAKSFDLEISPLLKATLGKKLSALLKSLTLTC